ncbi:MULTISPECIES: DUF2730 family protein [Vibrio]|jgi:hypothetical protein|uniref:DUF2730 family protein n=1 Tax=Vibrio TaxID=662 RepID=UPI000D33608E|nr:MULTISPECIES: DUF2730 family protein [Vibrio]PTP90103.1 DUF2730 domain-containing protein [Vibrio splendidus]
MKPETIDAIRAFTPWVMWGIGIGGTFAAFAMKKTFAEKKEVETLRQEHEVLKSKVSGLPNHEEFYELKLSIEAMRGDLKALSAALQPLQHISNLRLENDLRDKETA